MMPTSVPKDLLGLYEIEAAYLVHYSLAPDAGAITSTNQSSRYSSLFAQTTVTSIPIAGKE